MISFIVPAYNEEAWVGHCLAAIRNAMQSVGGVHEILVVDDSSEDGTSAVAQQHGARVIRVEHRQISATRNAGARAAQGEVFFFVDADTLISGPVIQAALQSLRAGAIGGGCVPRFEGKIPLWWRLVYPVFLVGVRLFRQPGGSCLFCTRGAFAVTGGFSEAHYAAEDAVFVSSLRRNGRFVVLKQRVITSGRTLRVQSFTTIARLLTRLVLRGPNGFRKREGLDVWYRPKREAN